MTYEEALNYISSTYKFGKKIGLELITELMERLGNPQDKLKYVHVAGTNGKGSTSTMTATVLKKAGYKTGLYISPYLEVFNERIQINNIPISNVRLAEVTEKVKDVIDGMIADGIPQPSEFETITAIAFEYYAEENVDIVVLEVGMGGRLDATNIIKNAEVAIICTLSLEHQQYLGNTLREIAFEKSGIIKHSYDVSVYALTEDEAKEEILRNAKEREANVYFCDKDDVELVADSIDGQVIKYKKQDSILGIDEYTLALLGSHQIYNSLNVINALEILKRKGWDISPEAILAGMNEVKFTGRFELLCKEPVIVIDGGHNIEGINSFVSNVKRYFGNRKVNLFYGMLGDKQVDQSVEQLASISEFIYTLTPDDARAVTSNEMKDYINKVHPEIPVISLDYVEQSGQYIDFTRKDTIYAFTGSLYMIGYARTYLNKLIEENK